MEYKLRIATETNKDIFCFEKKRNVNSFNELVEYVNEMVKIFKKSAKVVVVVYDECDVIIAQYNYDYGWVKY